MDGQPDRHFYNRGPGYAMQMVSWNEQMISGAKVMFLLAIDPEARSATGVGWPVETIRSIPTPSAKATRQTPRPATEQEDH